MERFIFCMKWGSRYGPEYVNRLHRGLRRYTHESVRFVCFTDDASGIDDGIEVFPLPLESIPGTDDLRWRKLGVFRRDLFGLQGRALFLDLDTVIVGSLSPLLADNGCMSALHEMTLFPRSTLMQLRRRILKPRRYRWSNEECNTSAFAFNIGQYSDLLDQYLANAQEYNRRYRREQEFVTHFLRKRKQLTYWSADWCVSFKENCRVPGTGRGKLTPRHLPPDARVVVFVNHLDMNWALQHRDQLGHNGDRLAWLEDHWS